MNSILFDFKLMNGHSGGWELEIWQHVLESDKIGNTTAS